MTDNAPQPGLLHSYEHSLGVLQRLADAFWIVAAYYVACAVYPKDWVRDDTILAGIATFAFHMMAEAGGLYRPWRGSPILREAVRVIGSWALVAPVLLAIAFITKTSADYSRFVTITWFTLTPAVIVGWRVIVRTVLRELRRRGRNSRNVGIAGATEMAEKLIQQIRRDEYLGMRMTGLYDDRTPDRCHDVTFQQLERHGDLDQLVEDARTGLVDIVYITLPLRAEPRINEILRKLADTTATVYVVADFFVFDLLRAQWSSVGEIPVVSIFDTPFAGVGGWLKRFEDIVVGSAIVAIIALPMLLIAIAVKLSSPGPVFFKQKRYGLNGREINVLKFRSMRVHQEGAMVRQATRNDPRITAVGAFLRRTSLDELPQFLQVITGEMSVVGPRPHAVSHNELYRSQIHGYMLRHKVKPGITGWAQVNGWRGETETFEKMEKRVEHDLDYINNWRLLWDLEIIFLTVFGSKARRNAF